MDLSKIKALTFDVFGTVADWRSTIIREGRELSSETGVVINWTEFADAWRAGYQPAMEQVRSGNRPWQNIDDIHHKILDELLLRYDFKHLSEEQKYYFNQVWHRLDPWAEARAGLVRLRNRFLVTPLSNGNLSLLTELSKNADLRWDCILSAELFQNYKPEPEVYLGAAHLLDLEPESIMMVAAHNKDLAGARAVGFSTAFVLRSTEYGPFQKQDLEASEFVDVAAQDFNDLADKLGCPT